MSDEMSRGGSIAAGVAVREQNAGAQLAGPGTGRTHSEVLASRGERLTSFDPADFPPIHGREEDWRFTPINRLRGLHESPVTDGKVSVTVCAPDAARVETVGRDDPRLGAAGAPMDRVGANAFAGFGSATVITVPKDLVLAEPIRVSLHGEGGVVLGHLQVAVERFASAVVVLEHTGSAAYADNVEFLVADGAKLTVLVVHDWDGNAVHVSQQHARIGRDASFKSINVTFGGDVVRVVPQVKYTGPGGDAELLGVYFADDGQHLEQRLFVDHAVPNCRSRVTYKGALQGAGAHTVWIGDVLIRAAAEGTDTYELNRNLVLSDGARADSVPNLEIETGEIVGAGHASATGRFDDEQLFYLQARGIAEDEARRLVVRGFFADVIGRIGLPDIEQRLMEQVDAELARTVTR